ncbi:hypothetical protein RGQ29_013281, partial [Quercus rubra]
MQIGVKVAWRLWNGLSKVWSAQKIVIALGVLVECWRKNSCFPFLTGVGISGRWEILESPGQGEVNPRELESKIKKKRGQYQSDLQPFYQLCKMNEVKLEVQFAAGFRPCQLAVEEAQKSNACWVVLDSYECSSSYKNRSQGGVQIPVLVGSHFKKFKEDIRGHINCNLAVVKGKDIAAIMTSTAVQDENFETLPPEEESPALLSDPESPCWYPLSWRSGFPRAFDNSELKVITNDFDDYNIVSEEDGMKVYHGFLQDIPVLVKCFLKTDERFWSTLKILSQVRHRHIRNIVGYCCADDSVFLLCDCPCMDTVEVNLQCDDLAKVFGWKSRWCVALEIGGSLRYLHEECVDGPIVQLSVCSAHVVNTQGNSAMLGNFTTAKWLTDKMSPKEDSPAESQNLEEDERLYVDVHDYGMFLLELITFPSPRQGSVIGQLASLTKQTTPLLENGSLSQLMDHRLTDTSDMEVVNHMANAALCCLKNVKGRRLSMSEVLAVVRGEELALSKY